MTKDTIGTSTSNVYLNPLVKSRLQRSGLLTKLIENAGNRTATTPFGMNHNFEITSNGVVYYATMLTDNNAPMRKRSMHTITGATKLEIAIQMLKIQSDTKACLLNLIE